VRRQIGRSRGDQRQRPLERLRHQRAENRHVAAHDPHQHPVRRKEHLAEPEQQLVILGPVDPEQIVLDRADAREVTAVRAADVAAGARQPPAPEAGAQQDLATHEAGGSVEGVGHLVEGVLDETQRRDPGGVTARCDLAHKRPPGTDPLKRGRHGDRPGATGPAPWVKEAAAGDLAVHRHDHAAAGIELAVGSRDHRPDRIVGDDGAEATAPVDVVERVAEDLGDAQDVARRHVADGDLAASPGSPEHHHSLIARCRPPGGRGGAVSRDAPGAPVSR